MSESINIEVRDTDQAAAKIKEQADNCLKALHSGHGCEGVTPDMIEYCKDRAGDMIKSFAAANQGGVVQKTIVVEKIVREGRAKWVKECQVSLEIDADKASTRTGQNGHLGCEVYFANKAQCVGKFMGDWRAGKRIFKMHAYLPRGQDPPHSRHEQDDKEHNTILHEGSTWGEERKIKQGENWEVLYRCRITTTRPGNAE
jgi:hypothetical protein